MAEQHYFKLDKHTLLWVQCYALKSESSCTIWSSTLHSCYCNHASDVLLLDGRAAQVRACQVTSRHHVCSSSKMSCCCGTQTDADCEIRRSQSNGLTKAIASLCTCLLRLVGLATQTSGKHDKHAQAFRCPLYTRCQCAIHCSCLCCFVRMDVNSLRCWQASLESKETI